MPSSPELRDGAGKVGMIEVLFQCDPKGLGDTAHNIHASGEIGIDLDGVKNSGNKKHDAMIRLGIVIDLGYKNI